MASKQYARPVYPTPYVYGQGPVFQTHPPHGYGQAPVFPTHPPPGHGPAPVFPTHQYAHRLQTPSKLPQRRSIDIAMAMVLPLVWIILLATTCIMIWLSKSINTTQTVRGIVTLSFLPILLASVLNEMVVDRCWRRVMFAALGDSASADNTQLAKNLRAANFQWNSFLKRMCTCKVSLRDWRSLIRYMLIRWGTAIGIASTPFSVRFIEDGDTGNYFATRKLYWIGVPTAIHALSILLALAIWWLPPWTAFGGGYDDAALLSRYQPYLDRVAGGSIAGYETIASFLAQKGGKQKPVTLRQKYTPGRHVINKFCGIWSGILFSNIPPILADVLVTNDSIQRRLTESETLFVIHLGFLAQNICYLFALDFVVWNLAMEGLCKTRSSRPKQNIGYLGSNSGIMLLIKAITQGRPLKVTLFLWLFLLQSIVIRGLSLLFIIGVELDGYGPDPASEISSFNGNFWLGWMIVSGGLTVPLFALWLFMPHQAPVCSQDGWRWATIARTQVLGEGNYGIKHNRACWGLDVYSFSEWTGTELE